MSEYKSMSVKELKQLMDKHGIPTIGCIEKSDLIERITQTTNDLTASLKSPNDVKGAPNHVGVVMSSEDEELINVTQESVDSVCKNVHWAVQRLKNEYPPSRELVASITAAINMGKRINEFVQQKFLSLVAQLLKKILEDNGRVSVFINLLGCAGNIAAYPMDQYKQQVASDGLLQVLSSLYPLLNSPANVTPSDSPNFPNITKINKISLNKLCVLLLANVTISDPITPRVLRVPHLYDLGSSGIFIHECRQSATLFLMNTAYESIGKDLLIASKLEMFEALADYTATVTDHDTLEQIYLTFTNVFVHTNTSARNKILKAIAARKFFSTSIARDIKKLNVNAVGLMLNVSGKGLDFHLAVSKEFFTALTEAAKNKSASGQILDLIGGILRNFSLNDKEVSRKLVECEIAPLLKQLTYHTLKSISEYAHLLLSRVETLTGEVDTLEQKCFNVGCSNRGAKMKKCSACGGAWYCSRDCQLADWKAVHKELCPKIKARVESGEGKVGKKQGNLDRTVAMKFINEHQPDFAEDAKKKGLQLDQCVVVVNFTSIDRNRTSVYSIPEFFEKAIKEEPFAEAGDIDLQRMRNSHAKSERPTFIAIVIQATTIFTFVVPVHPSLAMFSHFSAFMKEMAAHANDDSSDDEEDSGNDETSKPSDELD